MKQFALNWMDENPEELKMMLELNGYDLDYTTDVLSRYIHEDYEYLDYEELSVGVYEALCEKYKIETVGAMGTCFQRRIAV